MKNIKDISDELWIGIMLILAAAWLLFLDFGYLLISAALMIVGLFLIVIDSVKSPKSINANKNEKKSVKTDKK